LALELGRRGRGAEERAVIHAPAAEDRAADVADREPVQRLGTEVDGAIEAGRFVALVAGAHDVADFVPRDGRTHPFPALAQVLLHLAERPVRKALARIEPVVEREVHLRAIELAAGDPAPLEVRIRHVLEAGRPPPPGRVPVAPHEPLPLRRHRSRPAPNPTRGGGARRAIAAWPAPAAPGTQPHPGRRCKARAAGAGSLSGSGFASARTAKHCGA